ncbi:pkd domain containing protein [Pseudochryseolinea flava]|uniref:Pkd domain containing protein n=2 Tax=Pseudochryseolinea flava TaxID=2059302 RepID=A0A364XV68_9BACT|nr:pkd domain containing protein [Pseudochryseolinea flava]
MLLWQSCSEDDYPVPPASTVPRFSNTIDNDEFAPATVTFKNESIVPDRAGDVTYQWSFGDGTSSREVAPTHLYSKPGAYKVNLVVVTTSSMEINEFSKTIVIKDPNASGTPVFFTDGSTVFTALINDQEPVVTSIGINSLQDSYGMALDTVNNKLYIADFDGDKILVADADGKNLQDFRTNVGEPDAVAIDYATGTLYWDTPSGIRRADMSNTDLGQFENFVTGQSNDPEGISIDPVNRVLYWNNYDGGVWKKGLDSGGESEIIPGGQGGASVLVVGDRIFFDEFIASGDIYLKSANLDGSGIATVATGISRVVYGLAYDKDDNKIYWVDRNKSNIMRANLDGTSSETWASGYSARGLVIGKKK